MPENNLLPLSKIAAFVQEAKSLPAKPHINSVRRWIIKGSRGRQLAAELVGGRWYASEEAVREFLTTPPNKIVVGRHATRQQTAAHRAAVQEADRLGI